MYDAEGSIFITVLSVPILASDKTNALVTY